ncbi:hypothetical protein DSM21852_26520 [Methylocystis bryophila]|nr:hypothetical protein DSM21852_26520 [Methylocystis bryophila]
MGDKIQAIPGYSKAIGLDPNYAEAYQNRSRSYDRHGEEDQSISDTAKAKSLRLSSPPGIEAHRD